MEAIRHRSLDELEPQHSQNGRFEYERKEFLSKHDHANMVAGVYTIPPQKAAYPYHYHTRREEVFYIISGQGILRSPEGERTVKAGDLLYFAPTSEGAHQLINSSDSLPLVYLDVDYRPEQDVAVYPDSGKIGVWGKGIDRVYKLDDNVDYFEGE